MAQLEPYEKLLIDYDFIDEDVHGQIACEVCHGGDPSTDDMQASHQGVIKDPTFPDATKTCGTCHMDEGGHPEITAMNSHNLHVNLDPFKVDGNLPFNLQKTENLVWVFQGVNYYEEKTRTRYVGGSQGVSIRIAKGVYYRTGAFKGERVQSSETVHADTGLLGVTNKHIYFAGSSKRFRIAFNKIVSFEPFSDGIGVQRDAQTAKAQSFQTGDGWFTYNLITNLAQM